MTIRRETGLADWSRAGATLSDTSARDDFGLTQEQIIQAIADGKLQYRENSLHGNPWLRLLTSEVEALVREIHGESYLTSRNLRRELAEIDSQLRKAKAEVTSLTRRRAKLLTDPENIDVGEQPRADRKT